MADWSISILVLTAVSLHLGPRVSPEFSTRDKLHSPPGEIYANGGGLPVAPINAPQLVGWLRGTVVERRALTGKLSLSCARPAADG